MIKYINTLNEKIGQAVSWLTTLLILFVCFDVFRRYLLKDSAAWIMEMEWHLFAFIFLLSAGYTLKHNKHVRVDLFYDNFSKRDQAWVNLIGTLFFLIPWCCVIIYVSFNYACSSWVMNEGSPDPGGLPARYIVKLAVTLGFILLLLQALVMGVNAFQDLKSKPQE